jgi:hypothetical protein
LALTLGLGAQPGNWVNWVLSVMLLLLLWTIFNRVRGALRNTAAV